MINFRPLTKEDLPYRIKWLNDSEVNQFLGAVVRDGTDTEFHNKWFESYFADERAGKRKIFMILDEEKPIGQVGLLDINQLDKNAELYIVIGEAEYRGKGIGKEAMKFIIDYGFSGLKLHRISLHVHAPNEPAIDYINLAALPLKELCETPFFPVENITMR